MRPRAWWWVAAAAVFVAIAGVAGFLAWRQVAYPPPPKPVATPPPAPTLVGQPLPSLEGAVAWINGAAPPADSLRGRVTAVLFWDDGTLRCLRALAAALEWRRRYASYGLHLALVHVPRFAFQHDADLVAVACTRLGVEQPVALDEDYTLSRRFLYGGLPMLVVADTAGIVRLQRARALDAYESERVIRGLLGEGRGTAALPAPAARAADQAAPASGGATGATALGVGESMQLPDTPLAAARAGETHVFTPAFNFQVERADGVPVPVGRWLTGEEALRSARGTASDYLAIRYHGRDVYVLMGAPAGGEARMWVLQDDRWLRPDELGADARGDEHGASLVVVDAVRVYHVVRNQQAGSHVLKLQPDRPGVELYQLYFEP